MASHCLTGALLDQPAHRIHVLEANGERCWLRESQPRLCTPARGPEKALRKGGIHPQDSVQPISSGCRSFPPPLRRTL